MVLQIVAIVTPAAGKFDRAAEVLNTCAEGVQKNEPNALKYKPFKSTNAEGQPIIVVLEEYTDTSAIEAHRETEHYKTAIAAAQSEGLLAKPLDLMKLDPMEQGFESR